MGSKFRFVDRSQDLSYMQRALELAEQGASLGEVPVGAVLVENGGIIGEGFNQPITANDPSAHAEVVAIRQAAQRLKNYRLPNTTLYVTLEPCSMCAGLIVHARILRVVYAALEPRAGAVMSQQQFFSNNYLNHQVMVEKGAFEQESAALLKQFFQAKRRTQTK